MVLRNQPMTRNMLFLVESKRIFAFTFYSLLSFLLCITTPCNHLWEVTRKFSENTGKSEENCLRIILYRCEQSIEKCQGHLSLSYLVVLSFDH